MSNYLTQKISGPAILGHARNSQAAGRQSFLRRWMTASAERWQRYRMVQALERLDDRMLADIGLCRGDIPRIVELLDGRELRMNPVARPRKAEELHPYVLQKAA